MIVTLWLPAPPVSLNPTMRLRPPVPFQGLCTLTVGNDGNVRSPIIRTLIDWSTPAVSPDHCCEIGLNNLEQFPPWKIIESTCEKILNFSCRKMKICAVNYSSLGGGLRCRTFLIGWLHQSADGYWFYLFIFGLVIWDQLFFEMENKGVGRRTNDEVQDLLRQCVEQLEATQDYNTLCTSYEEANPGDSSSNLNTSECHLWCDFTILHWLLTAVEALSISWRGSRNWKNTQYFWLKSG